MAEPARKVITDPFHAFNFRVQFQSVTGGDLGLNAGFTTCTMPEESVEVVEFKDSTMKYKQKYPGIPSVSDVTLTRGVIKTDQNPNGSKGSSLTPTTFSQSASPAYHLYAMLKAGTDYGSGQEYRFHTVIYQIHRDGKARKYTLYNCVATRFKTSSDLDANASDIAVEELDLAYEYFMVEDSSSPGEMVLAKQTW